MNRSSLLAVAGAALALAGATAAPAAADSIAYVQNGDVHLATPDGSRTYQVTFTGGYDSVSQDDAGRLVAVHGNRIAHLERDGRVISDILTPVSNPSGTQRFWGPYDAQVSPDGAKVSYTYYWEYIGTDPYCQPSNGCYTKRTYHGTGYTHPDRLTAWDEPGYRRRSGWIHGSWMSNTEQLLSDPYIKPNEDLVFDSPGLTEAAGLKRWAEHVQAKQMTDGEVTRNRHKMAYITGDNQERIWFYNLRTGFYPGYPSSCTAYEVNGPAGKFGDLSWSPSGAHLAYSDDEGVHTVAIPEFGTAESDCGTPTEQPRLLAAGARSPDWGPADLPPARPAPAPAPGVPAPPAPTSPAPPVLRPSAPRGGSSVTARDAARPGPFTASSSRLAPALRGGLTIRVRGAKPGKRKFVARSGSSVVATGTAKVGSNGTASVRLKFTVGARKRLKAKKTVSLRITGGGLTGTVVLKK